MRRAGQIARLARSAAEGAEIQAAALVRPGRRRGSLLVEVALASVVLMIAMTLTVKILGFVAFERREAERREHALVEAGNLMERITGYPYQSVTSGLAGKMTLSAPAKQLLPGAELAIDVTESQLAPGRPAKRIAMSIRWRNRAGEFQAPVRLTSWITRRRTSS